MQFPTAIVDFNLFYDGTIDMQIRALLTRNPLGVHDTQVTVMACGPFVHIFILTAPWLLIIQGSQSLNVFESILAVDVSIRK